IILFIVYKAVKFVLIRPFPGRHSSLLSHGFSGFLKIRKKFPYLPGCLTGSRLMKIFLKGRGKYILLSAIICQIMFSYCSRRIFPEPYFSNLESPAEKKKLNIFIEGGIEKGISTLRASPDEIINTAQKYLGVPHCMGGMSSKCMDCSGLLVTVFATHG